MKPALVLVLCAFTFFIQPLAAQSLEDVFANPPIEAKPRGYWLWSQGNFDYSRIVEELKEFKDKGLGGVDIIDLGVMDPLNVIPEGPLFFSDEQLDGMTFAFGEAKNLGLKMGLSVSNGWNAGGEWTTADEMIMHILVSKTEITGPKIIDNIPFPEVPATFKKPYGSFPLYPRIDSNGFPEYYEDVSLIAFPVNEQNIIASLDEVLVFDPKSIRGNKVELSLPEGDWMLMRFVMTPLWQRMYMKGENTESYIMDHFSKKATHHHFSEILGRLEERLGKLSESSLERLYLCSFESEAHIEWSTELAAAFMKLNAYAIDPYLPVLEGYTVISKEQSERFIYDYRKTISEMFVNNHYRQARQMCNEKGLLLASESGGPGPPLHRVPTEDLKALGAVDVMRGEFWNKKGEYFDENGNDLLQVVKNIGSAAHIYGHSIVEMEAFTSHQKFWQETPMDLKILADNAFCEGMTRVVYHTMPHSPKEAGLPGWSYIAGTHISPKLTWWPLSDNLHTYFSRVSALLQQGHFVADVAYYYGEEVPKFASGTKYIKETLGPGYDYDDLNTEVLLQITEVRNGRIILPSGMEYAVLVLPGNRKMSVEVMNKIEELLNKGAVISGAKPQTVYGLKEYRERTEKMLDIADRIWGKRSKEKLWKKYGRGVIASGYSEREVLNRLGVHPDFVYQGSSEDATLDFVHRSTGKEEIYFVRNKSAEALNALVGFRVSGMQPEQWNPVTGVRKMPAAYIETEQGTSLAVHLDAYESTFVVFKEEPAATNPLKEVRFNDHLVFSEDVIGEEEFDCYFEGQLLQFMAEQPGNYELVFRDGTSQLIDYHGKKDFIELKGPWDVRFAHGWGFAPVRVFPDLIDWLDHENEALSNYSGLATYKNSFEIAEVNPAVDYELDLGCVGEVARVYLNGKEVGTSLFTPHTLNLKGALREGENNLVIDVANTWLNQLISESKTAPEDARTSSNLAAGDKKRLWQNYDPLSSGLLGPVKITVRPQITLE